MDILNKFISLMDYCEESNFQGWDPYDGLNSIHFQNSIFNNYRITRLIWVQLFKRNPINLRKIMKVQKGHNPKALGLFLSGYTNIYNSYIHETDSLFNGEKIKETISSISEYLINLQSNQYSGSCWGYNFDWQARGNLYFKSYTPTVVATCYAVNGLLDANEILDNEKILDICISSGDFVLKDLNRTKKENGFLFSYSPVFGNNTVYNASVLGSRLLSRLYSLTGNEEYADAARLSILACCDAQLDDGSWYYGELDIQKWKDSFHTGFILESLYDYQKFTGDYSFESNYKHGFEYYHDNFFIADGTPKYYNNNIYPIDIHCPAQFIITSIKTGMYAQNNYIVDNVLKWTIDNMMSKYGFFYYQKNILYTNKISYMRWSQSWMFLALSYYININNNMS